MRKPGLLLAYTALMPLFLPVHAGGDEMPPPKRSTVDGGEAQASALPSNLAYDKARAAMLLLMLAQDGRIAAPGAVPASRR